MKTAVFFTATLLFGVLLAELTLKGAAFISPRIAYELRPPWSNRALDPDPVLGYRVSPFYPGSDKRGYRNPVALNKTDILAIGDSLTYGYSVIESESWPSVLRRESGLQVYNAGVGGYGPCEYLQVANELIDLSPKTVVVGMYLGNDMSDAYTSVYLEERCEKLRSTDSKILDVLKRSRTELSLKEQATDLGLASVPEPFRDGLPLSHLYGNKLRDKSAIYALFRTVYHRLTNFQWNRFGEKADESYENSSNISGTILYDEIKELRTVFKSPAVEVLAVDQNDPRIYEGRRITESALLDIRMLMREVQNVNMIVAIIPTKGVVYSSLFEDEYIAKHNSFIPKIENELKLKNDLILFLESENIDFVDTTSLLEASLNVGQSPFHESSNEHPNEHGYKIIAEAIADVLAE